ncbi:unnamed protein product [Leptidea sinapis]|uniref:Proline-rich protein PRCC n=1 Tax=Leptidea sinapis TaxID=189913 RepID=A0A5E4QWU9_9NEOP|nr:unnamed protein product [Leptidea sinapis]
MALVAYDNSDSDTDYEDETSENPNDVVVTKLPPSILNTIDGNHEGCNEKNLFIALPKPTISKSSLKEENDEFLLKKEKQPDVKPKSRITVPSLNDFKDVKNTIPDGIKSKPTNGKKSGLLSLLPQPKSESSMSKIIVPQSVKKNNQLKPVLKTTFSSKDKGDHNKKSVIEYSDESDDEIQNDFFSINKKVELPPVEVYPDIDIKESVSDKKEPSIESYFKKEDNHVDLQNNVYSDSVNNENYIGFNADYVTPETYNNSVQAESNDVLDEEAILKLCGARGKRKREEIQIVDVNQQDVLKDARELLMKGLMDDTTKRQSHSKKRGNEPTSQQKRKHQITYLAHQAKANEAELQNQWANNRMTKRMTQSKYGF